MMNLQPRSKPASTPFAALGTPVAVVAKAGVCVALIAALAWIAISGDGTPLPATDAADEARTQAPITIAGDRAAAHRRQLFEERRMRYSAHSHAQVAGNDVAAVQAP